MKDVFDKCKICLLLPVVLLTAGCSLRRADKDVLPALGPLPIELNFTVSDAQGNNLLDPAVADSFAPEDISVVYQEESYLLDAAGDGPCLRSVYNHENIRSSLIFGQLDGSQEIEAQAVSLVLGDRTYTVMVSNFYDPARDARAERHFYWHNKDWYGDASIDIVVQDEPLPENPPKQAIG